MRHGARAVLIALAAALGLVGWRPATAQTADDLLRRGLEAYRGLELETAAGLLRRVLAFDPDSALARDAQADALSHLAAAELFRDRRDSATAAFRRLVLLAPRYRPDARVFPPLVLGLFDEVRRDTRVVEIEAPRDTTVRLGAEAYPVRLYASAVHDIAVTVTHPDGRALVDTYRGPIGDSLTVGWNGLDATGAPARAGSYYLGVASLGADGRRVRLLQVPLTVTVAPPDTLPHPPPPADSLLLPERLPAGPALGALAAGLFVGGLAAGIPGLLGEGGDAAASRLFVGGAVAAGGLIGFVTRAPWVPIREHIVANERLFDAWRAERDAVAAENRRRIADERMHVQRGAPVRIDEERR